MRTQLPGTNNLQTQQSLNARRDRLQAAQLKATQYWDRLKTPATPEELVSMRIEAGQAWERAAKNKPADVHIDTQVDTRFNNLKALYAAEYLSMMHRSVTAEAAAIPYEPRHLDAARQDFRTRLGSILTSFVERKQLAPGYLSALTNMVLINEHASHPPMEREQNLAAVIARIKADHPAMKDIDLADHPSLRQDFEALCDASYHYQETDFTHGLHSAIRSILAPGSHTISGDKEVKEMAQEMVAHVIMLSHLGYSEQSIFDRTTRQLPYSFQKWLDVTHALEEKPELKSNSEAVTIRVADPEAPFPGTLNCYVEHRTGIRTPTKEELEARYSLVLNPTTTTPPADSDAVGKTRWAADRQAQRQLSAVAAFKRS